MDDDWEHEFGDGMCVIYDDVVHTVHVFSTDVLSSIQSPGNYDAAINSPLANRWQQSMEEEIKGLLGHKTWTLVSRNELPKGKSPVKSRWVYTIKFNRDGTIERFKSRFVVCGYSQVQGRDYERAFSATMRATSFRTLMAMAAIKKLRMEHLDVKNAFTQADIGDVDIYVEPPKGFEEWEEVNGRRMSKLLKLRKALYGTKQASRLWQETLGQFLTTEAGFTQLVSDPCIFVRVKDGKYMVLGIYVDDIICAHDDSNQFEQFFEQFGKAFNSKHLGKLSWFLGMAIDQVWDRDSYTIHVHQTKNIRDMVEKFAPDHASNKIKHAKPYNVDTFKNLKTGKDTAKEGSIEHDVMKHKMTSLPYLSLVGSLMYVAFMTRPDIAFAMAVLCKYMSDPSPECHYAALSVLQYLANTEDMHLIYEWNGKARIPVCDETESVRAEIEANFGLHMFTDSSWGEAYPSYGYAVFLANGCISYLSKQLKLVCESSCEAEYAAVAYASKEYRFVVNLLNELQLLIQAPYISLVDNSASRDVALDKGVSGRTKHFDLAIHVVRKLVEDRFLHLVWIPRSAQMADWFTHILTKTEFACIRAHYYSLNDH
jgi:hypothetical protein